MWIGCCGWAEARPVYFGHFPAVELQTTFYQPPTTALATKWRAAAPREFLFCMKAWQLITHAPSSPTYRRLKAQVPAEKRDAYGFFRPTDEVREAWRETLAVARALHAAAIVFQCPASFRSTSENRQNLAAFLGSIERDDWLTVWEPRGEWDPLAVRDLCERLDLVHCVDPFQAEPLWGRAAYFRLHGRGGYRYRYTDEDLRFLGERCRRQGDLGRDPVYVLFNNYSMKEDARRFQALTGCGE